MGSIPSSSKARCWVGVGSAATVTAWSGLPAKVIRLRMSEARWSSRVRRLCTGRPSAVVRVAAFRLALGEKLFVDYAGMTVPLRIDGWEHPAQVFVAAMGVSGRLYAEATLVQIVDDWCATVGGPWPQ